MSIIPEQEIIKRFLSKYNQNPLGWNWYEGISSTGHPELLITHPKDNWLIKRDSPYSNTPGVGVELEQYIKPRLATEKIGFRPLPKYAMKKIVAMVQEGIEPMEAMKIIEAFTKEILRQ